MRTEISQGKERLNFQPFQENIDQQVFRSSKSSRSEQNVNIEHLEPVSYIEKTEREEIFSIDNSKFTRLTSFLGLIIYGAYSSIKHFISDQSENSYFKFVTTTFILTTTIVILLTLYYVQEDMHRYSSLQVPKSVYNETKSLFM